MRDFSTADAAAASFMDALLFHNMYIFTALDLNLSTYSEGQESPGRPESPLRRARIFRMHNPRQKGSWDLVS